MFSASAAAAEEKSSWRREGPLPPIEPSHGGPRQSSYANSPSVPEEERDWGAARGSKFVPSAEPVRAGPPGGGPPRSGGFVSESGAAAEAASQWRSNKPVATGPVQREAPPHQRGGPMGGPGGFRPSQEGPPSAADTESEWTRGGKFVPSVDRSNPSSRRGSSEHQGRGSSPFPPSGVPADESPADWRSNMRRGPPGGSGDRSPAPGSPQPMSRRPLGLLPRSQSSTAPASPDASSPSSPALASAAPAASKASPFGAARPVDNAAKAKEVEEKLARQEAELRERRQKDKEARDLKAKTFVRAPPVGDRRSSANNSPKPEEGAKKVEGDVREEDKKAAAATDKAPVSLGAEVTPSPKRSPAQLKETKEQQAKKDEKAFSFSALEVEGGEDDDEVDEVADKVKETSI